MNNVKVLLRENVNELGRIGDVVDVRSGYARNYLLPQRLAVEATPENIKMLERRRTRYEAELAHQEAEVSKKIEILGNVRLAVSEKSDEGGTLYGSVGPAIIARLLTEAGYPTKDKDVRLDEPIKSVGTHEVPIHIHGEHYAGIQVVVSAAE